MTFFPSEKFFTLTKNFSKSEFPLEPTIFTFKSFGQSLVSFLFVHGMTTRSRAHSLMLFNFYVGQLG